MKRSAPQSGTSAGFHLTTIVAAVNVLLIDDDSDDVYLVRRELERYGIDVEWAPGFDAGVDAFRSRRFDAVLVDHFLGARTGLEFLRHAGAQRPGVPIILITGLESQEVDDAALEAGAAGFILKGDARGDLLSRTIRYAIRASRESQATPRADPRPKPGGKDLTLQVALSRGMTIRDAAKAAGMSERTAYRRMNDPVFQEQLTALESELRQRMVDRTVEDILNTEP
jgi:DNA-binding response OmpR family regulator